MMPNVSQPTEYPHVVLDGGWSRIEGSRMKVHHLASAHLLHGWSAQELQRQFPDLSLAVIHSALAYYYDHRAEIDRQVAEADAAVQKTLHQVAVKRPSREALEERARTKGLHFLLQSNELPAAKSEAG